MSGSAVRGRRWKDRVGRRVREPSCAGCDLCAEGPKELKLSVMVRPRVSDDDGCKCCSFPSKDGRFDRPGKGEPLDGMGGTGAGTDDAPPGEPV